MKPAVVVPEESVPLRVAVLVAVVTASLAVLQQGVGHPLLYLAVLVGLPAGFAYSHHARHRSPMWPKVAAAVGAGVAMLWFLQAIGDAGARTAADAQLPLAELFVWVQVLHGLDVPARRNLRVSLMSSLVLIAVAGTLSLSLDYGVFLAVWTVAAVAALVLADGSEQSDVRPLSPMTRARPGAGVAVVGAVVLAVAGVVFALLPAAGSARAVTFPMALPDRTPAGGLPGAISNPSLGGDGVSGSSTGAAASFAYTGFSESLDTAVRGRPDDTLVMRVRASAAALWRGQTFDRWDGRRWTATEDDPTPIGGGARIQVPRPADDPVAGQGERFVQTFYLEQPGPNLIFGAYSFDELYFADRRVFQLPDGALRTGVELADDAVYTVVSRRARVSEADLRAADGAVAPSLPPTTGRRTLQLPGVSPRVQALAAEVTAGAPTTYDKVQALIGWMGANTEYTLDIPPLPAGADAVEHFLFEERRGFCEQIGTALVVMLRSLGVPARLAVGYAPGERNPFTGLFEVRARDAHAWAEVWFDGIGWQGFDPTASVPPAADSGLRARSGLSSFVAARLPSAPVEPFAVAMVVVAVVLVRRRVLARRAAAARPWVEQWQDRLDDMGRARGRPRQDGESVREYVEVLRHIAPHPGWRDAVNVVEWEAYAGVPAPPERRAAADAVLTAARSPR